MAGIYLHIPFCSSRCIYCGFYSTTGKENLQDMYIDAIIKEFSLRKDYLKGRKVHTIYIGGGTPSLLSDRNLKKIHQKIYCAVKDDGIEEFTIECNPDDISPVLARELHNIGVTRVSMGAQTFNDDRLKFLHRRHRANQIAYAVSVLREAGINNISIDLMFGFPNEAIGDWEEDIEKAISLDVEHISAYSLMYEEGTTLYQEREKGLIKEIDEDVSAKMYDILINKLTKAGYEHYEISNFAKPGYRSMHNSNYWNSTWYLGLGAAAHSFDGETRGWNVSNIEEYIAKIKSNTLSSAYNPQQEEYDYVPAMEYEILDEDTKYNDLITTALRTREGIDLRKLQSKYYNYIIRNARKGIRERLIEISNEHIHLTKKGLYISDDIMSDLIYVED